MKTLKLNSKFDDLELAVVVSCPIETPKAVVHLVHGMCCCKEKFAPVMDFLSQNGVACISSDLRGHGQSIKEPNDRGYFYSGGYKAMVEDIRTVTEWGMKLFPSVPVYLLGYSMGSMAARIYAKQDDSGLAGLIVCSSPSNVALSVVARIMTDVACAYGLERRNSGVLQDMADNFYNRKFVAEGPSAWICSDPEARRNFRNMPQCNFKFTINGINNLMKMMEETYNLRGWCVANPEMPVLFISGADDPIMISKQKFDKAVKSMQRVGYKNVSSSVYPKMRHDILDEKDKFAVWNQILDFVKTR